MQPIVKMDNYMLVIPHCNLRFLHQRRVFDTPRGAIPVAINCFGQFFRNSLIISPGNGISDKQYTGLGTIGLMAPPEITPLDIFTGNFLGNTSSNKEGKDEQNI
jgi:hypothetical protein